MQKTEQRQKTGIPRSQYVIGRLRKTEMKKLRRWLDKKDFIEVFTHQEKGQVYIFKRNNKGS